jgi:acetyl-CoA acetyltransferase
MPLTGPRRRAHPQCSVAGVPRRPVRAALWANGTTDLFTIPVLRYMKTYGLSHETLAMVSVVQREWVAKNPRANLKAPITVEDVPRLR